MIMLERLSAPLATGKEGSFTWFLCEVDSNFHWFNNHLSL